MIIKRMPMAVMPKKVLIFTKRVLPLSNTFVAAQGNHLSEYQPTYIGLRSNSSGISLIAGSPTCVQSEHERFPALARLLLDGTQYLSSTWKKALSDISAEVVHAHFGKGGYYCSPISKSLSLPLITTFHGSDITQDDKFSYNQKHRNIAFTQSSKIIAVSKFIENKLLEKGCPSDKIVQHYIGIDTDYFSPSTQKNEQPTVLFVGRLIEQKGCQYLLQAMKTIQQALPEAQLIIAGDGNYRDKLMVMAQDIKHIHFLGAQNRAQVKQLMSDAWVTCLPSIRMARGNEEGMPTVCMESQAVGTPLVGFATGGVVEAVEHGVTGLLCAQKDSRLLAENLLSLLNSNSLRAQYSQNAIARTQQQFSITKQCKKLEAIYNSCL